MKRILFIEDRVERMKKFSPMNLFENKHIQVITGLEYDHFVLKLDKNDLNSLFGDFECIISHKSALDLSQRGRIKNYCETEKKSLIFFSGGISYSFYSDKNFPYLNINANDFYSDKLKLFLDEYDTTEKVNMPILQFGKNWELNKLLNFRNDLVKRSNEETIKRVRDLNIDEKLKQELNKLTNVEFINNEFAHIEKQQIKIIRTSIDQLIHELI